MDLALRGAGLMLLCLAALVGRTLFAVASPRGNDGPLTYAFALMFVVSGSLGAALAGWGRHLADPIELSARWTIHRREKPRGGGRR
ncbi:MAG TPA: hypothetical protein VNT42_00935 [Sphingomonas sp.]|nr:hypothetical protein [Sphingomonas sp.]